ncbi:ATP-binding cassette protein subfamily H, member 2 [Leishmania infantum JPCM5]|uniref:ATP-binding_cassette_protein_subfamily_H_-_member_2_-_putative n=2 Tax=Leishmania infantum TaxID=5671 RepID=A0A6L0XK65_LEIIN|nr:ATP-binding cassette protein subfamily H, member 2 [Leishmania infantum JPCM5]CAC9509122.1 ATP-binding_cassette_protein_subfamily_H_-_member_2_-_putative [Leishmania infantum]CAM69740.1 ATP-binding cassette protein subfamily H, member 2 [Leishmania infantum JPCM5]SUZ43681.1 ATP-binding_cassette_protein_subfamily_H_-_member_2_-_putative [Leishmania infantum]|eukprot:XP_001466697.1 ATP-binding cassette protein subfamily H, member 2 [Leishmania infantum JPCM5]
MSLATTERTPATVGKLSPSSGIFSIPDNISPVTAEEAPKSRDILLNDASLSELSRQTVLQSEPVVLRLCHVGKSYPIVGSDERVVALKDITLAEPEHSSAAATTQEASNTNCLQRGNLPPPFAPVRRGEFVMIRGPSGGGKTTLLNIIGSIDSCTEGTIELNGRIIDKDTKESVLADIRLKNLGFVFQTFNLIATMTAAENVELPMTLLGKMSAKAMRLRSRQLLTLVGLRNRINHLPSELSGGEQQRVTIARSLANNPSILLLDEPTGDLDTANTIEVMDLLMRINRRTKTTCIMVTHNPDIECYADRILYVSDGRFAREVFNTLPTCLNLENYTEYLAAKERAITGFAEVGAVEDDSEPRATAAMAGDIDNKGGEIQKPNSSRVLESITEGQSACSIVPPAASRSAVVHLLYPPAAATAPSLSGVTQTFPHTTHHGSVSVPPAFVSSALVQREEREVPNGL